MFPKFDNELNAFITEIKSYAAMNNTTALLSVKMSQSLTQKIAVTHAVSKVFVSFRRNVTPIQSDCLAPLSSDIRATFVRSLW
jgi:hypothetical protein